MRALKRSGQLDNTIVIYMSDNGFYFGEHRILSGKQYPYEPGLRDVFFGVKPVVEAATMATWSFIGLRELIMPVPPRPRCERRASGRRRVRSSRVAPELRCGCRR